MATSEERRWGVSYAATILTLASGCISTELDAGAEPPVCVAPPISSAVADSVVLIDGDLGATGRLKCSGVVIAPTLVVTDLLCIGLPIPLDPESLNDVAASPAFAGVDLYGGEVDYAADCYSERGWQPREDGDFSARLGEPIEPTGFVVSVLRDSEPVATYGVRRIVTSGADSRCWDSLALLVLDRPVEVPALPVRLHEPTSVGEAVILSGSGPGTIQPREVSASVQAVTFEVAEAAAPPRSLRVDQPLCSFQSGGAVAAANGGALIGVIGYGTTCYSEAAAEGSTLATRLAPFRRLLVEVASDAGEVLRVEAPASPEPSWPACASP